MTDTNYPGQEPQAEPIDAQFEPAPDPLPAKPGSSGPGWGGVAIAAVLAALAGAAGGIFGRDMLLPDRTAAMQQDLGNLQAQQAEFERQIAEMPEASDELSSLIGEVSGNSRKLNELLASGAGIPAVDELAARIETLERVDTSGSATPAEALRTIAALEARITTLETAAVAATVSAPAEPETPAPAPEKDRAAEAALALSAIESAARKGAAFEADYRTLRAAAPSNQTVRRLAPYVSGVPTISRLQSDFAAMKTAAIAAGKTDAANTDQPQSQLSWLSRVFGDAVTVRPAHKREDPVAISLDTASKALAAGDLSASVKALATLEGGAARAAQDWTREANRRITLEAVLEDVRLSLIEPEN